MQRRHLVLPGLGAALGLALALAGCAGTAYTTPETSGLPGPTERAAEGDYVIQRGDTLSLKFYFHPDNDQEVVVRQDGRVLLPLVGETQAAGLTPAQMADELVQKYSKNLRDPKVSVAVKASVNREVYVGGEVTRPGLINYRRGLTAVQAIMEAGGPKDTARVDQVVFMQKVREDHYLVSKIDLQKVLENGETSQDPMLGPADVIFVPKSTIAKMNLFVQQYIMNLLPIKPGLSFVPGI
jgi:protein involved in polysaccharide export with SLBB domain